MRRLTRREILRLASLGVLGYLTGCAPALPPAPDVAASPTPIPPTVVPPAATSTAMPTPRPVLAPRPFITPNNQLYVQTKSGGDAPTIDPLTWRLTFDGLVERPFTLTLEELTALPTVEDMRTLECIGNPAGGDLIGNVVWLGTPLRPLLERAGLKAGVVELVMRSADGYFTSLPRHVLLRDDALLVYRMNGEPLPKDHGFPVRLSIPGRYGQKQPKWLTRFEAVDQPALGYYEAMGWSNECFIRPNSRIDEPLDYEPTPQGEVTVRGIGMAGASGVARVEVTFDDGATWQEARLTRGPSPRAWTFWETRWTPPAPGRYSLLARLTDSDGKGQSRPGASFSILGPAFPDGTNEMHRITAHIVPSSPPTSP